MDTPIYNTLMNVSTKNWTAPTSSELEIWTGFADTPFTRETVVEKVVSFAKRTLRSLRDILFA